MLDDGKICVERNEKIREPLPVATQQHSRYTESKCNTKICTNFYL